MWHIFGRGTYKVLMGNLRKRVHLEALGEGGRVIRKLAYKRGWGSSTVLIGLGIKTSGKLFLIW